MNEAKKLAADRPVAAHKTWLASSPLTPTTLRPQETAHTYCTLFSHASQLPVTNCAKASWGKFSTPKTPIPYIIPLLSRLSDPPVLHKAHQQHTIASHMGASLICSSAAPAPLPQLLSPPAVSLHPSLFSPVDLLPASMPAPPPRLAPPPHSRLDDIQEPFLPLPAVHQRGITPLLLSLSLQHTAQH